MNGDEKVRTEVSPPSAKPEFSKAEFKFPVANGMEEGPNLVTLGAFVVLAGKDSTKGNAKLLGQCTLDVQNLAVQLLRGETVACNLVFTRKPKPDKEISVGRTPLESSAAFLRRRTHAARESRAGGRPAPRLTAPLTAAPRALA